MLKRVIEDRYVRICILAILWTVHIAGTNNLYQALIDRDYSYLISQYKYMSTSAILHSLLTYTVYKALYPSARLVIKSFGDNYFDVYQVPLSYNKEYTDICTGDDAIEMMIEEYMEYREGTPITDNLDDIIEEVQGIDEYIGYLIEEDGDIPTTIEDIFDGSDVDVEYRDWLSHSISLWKIRPWIDRILRDVPPYGCSRRPFTARPWNSDADIHFQ